MKTKKTMASVEKFLNSVTDEKQGEGSFKVLEMMKKIINKKVLKELISSSVKFMKEKYN